MNAFINLLGNHPGSQEIWAYAWRERGLCPNLELMTEHLAHCPLCRLRLTQMKRHRFEPLFDAEDLKSLHEYLTRHRHDEDGGIPPEL